MRKLAFIFLLCLAPLARAATRTAASASQTDVQTVVTASAPGDTVIIPSGSSTWSGSITLTRGIIITGAGVGNTNITKTNGNESAGGAFNIYPSQTAIDNEETIKLTGVTINGGGTSTVLLRVRGAGTTSGKAFKNLVVGDCRFFNTLDTISVAGTIYITGQVRGVIYNNVFDNVGFVLRVLGNDDDAEWLNGHFPFAYGNSDNLFFENNSILFTTSGGSKEAWTEIGQGGRVCIRYNTYNFANTDNDEVWDIHGFQNYPGGQTGTMIAEFYGNTIQNSNGYSCANHRGSWGMFHNNVYTNSTGTSMWISQYDTGCNAATGVSGGEINNTYFFNNVADAGAQVAITVNLTGCGISANNNWWNFTSSFNGSSGVGRGTASPVTAFPTATKGVGYWQNASPNPSTNPTIVQAGHFWKATANNTWTDYYTPYTYPHPLRSGGADVTPPTAASATVSASGTSLAIGFSESVNVNNISGFALTGVSGGAVTLPASASGSGTATLTFSPLSRTIGSAETGTLSYTTVSGGIEDTAGNDLASFSGLPITNNSTQGPPTLNTATINPAGNQLILVFSQTVQAGSGGNAGWALNVSPAASLGTVTGVGSNTLTYNITRTINQGESATLNYTQPGNGIESVATGSDLASISNRSVTNNSTQGATATPVITLPAGPYFGTQSTTITDSDQGSGAVIRYTVDGSTPTAGSPVYSTPISIATNQTIKAIATWSGHLDSAVASSAYEVVSWVCPPSPKTFQVPPKTGTFTWNFSITAPAAAGLVSMGIGPAPIATTGDMACIVQFSANTINAINGGAYTTGPAYSPGAIYNFVASVNVTAHTWTVTVTPAAGGATSTIVTNAAFRTEQAAAANVSYIGLLATTGSFTASNMSFPAGPSSARYIGLRGVPAAGGAVP